MRGSLRRARQNADKSSGAGSVPASVLTFMNTQDLDKTFDKAATISSGSIDVQRVVDAHPEPMVEVAPGKFMTPGRRLSRQEAMGRTFKNDHEVLKRLAASEREDYLSQPLDDEERDAFLAMIDDDSEPSERLLRAAARYKALNIQSEDVMWPSR